MSITIGWRIKALLKDKGMPQSLLAEKTNMTPQAVNRIINGYNEPRAYTLMELAKALDTSVDYILGIEQQKTFETRYVELLQEVIALAGDMTSSQKTAIIYELFNAPTQKEK